MKKETFKVWISKFALTKGVYEIEVESTSIDAIVKTTDRYPSYFLERQYHLTREEAVEQARKMQDAKLKSLEKQMNKISKLNFQ